MSDAYRQPITDADLYTNSDADALIDPRRRVVVDPDPDADTHTHADSDTDPHAEPQPDGCGQQRRLDHRRGKSAL